MNLTLQVALAPVPVYLLADQPDLSGKRVLIVDDNASNRRILTLQTRRWGMQPTEAATPAEALEMVRRGDALDLAILDMQMPEMDGLELMRILRADDRYFRIPIIALTAKAMKEDRIICLEAGASDYLTKPIDVNRLLAMLRIWLYR